MDETIVREDNGKVSCSQKSREYCFTTSSVYFWDFFRPFLQRIENKHESYNKKEGHKHTHTQKEKKFIKFSFISLSVIVKIFNSRFVLNKMT